MLDGTLPAEALRGRLPVVEACEWVPGLAVPRVKIDNRAAAALAIRHLADLGHRRIGHVTGPRGNVLTEARLSGAEAALSDLGIPLSEDALYIGDFSLDSGRNAAIAWLAQPATTRPTALFLASDAMAYSFIAEVQRHGLSVPRDISVVGFDDIELVAHLSPPLTTIRQPRTEIGRLAAERLLAMLADEIGPEDTVLPVELIIRSSTASPRDWG